MSKQPSEKPTYKIIHCKSQGLAEPTRMLLSYGGLKFEDIRLSPDEWQAFKPSMKRKFDAIELAEIF